jgi:hypothetical protein
VENIGMIKNKDMESFTGQIIDAIKVTGLMENKTDKEYSKYLDK